MEFTEESKPNVQHSVTTPLAPNIPSNPSSSPLQTLITSNSSPPPPPPSVQQSHSAIASPPPVLPSPSTFISSPPPPRFANNHDDDRYFRSFPPGIRFRPHDHELVLDYLTKKIEGLSLPRNRIVDVTLYQHDPEFLADKYKHYGEKELYFFTPRDRKYKNGTRPNRATYGGYWKATGADKEVIYDRAIVGYRKALVYYTGKVPNGVKTSWIMHEFRVKDPPPRVRNHGDDMRLDDWVLCRIYKKHEKRTNVNTNASNGQTNEEHYSGSMDDIDEDYLNLHDHNSNDLDANEAEFSGDIYDLLGNGVLENAFPIHESSQQQTALSGLSDADFSPAPANYSRMLQDTQAPNLAEILVDPAPLFSIDPDNRSSSQVGYQDEFLNPTNSSQGNVFKPTYFPRNPAPLVNLRPTNTAPPAQGLNYLNTAPPALGFPYVNITPHAGSLPPINTAPLICSLPPMNSAGPTGCLPPTNFARPAGRLPPTNPANSHPMSVTNVGGQTSQTATT